MERFVKDPHTLRQKRQGPLCPHIDEFAEHRKAPVTLGERTTIDRLLDDLSLYLQQERVLAPTTVANYVFLIKKFLTHRFGTGPADLSDLTAAQVVGSVQRLVPSLCRKRAKVMTSALRSFLRYARYQDFIRSDLAACVPSVADWSVPSIPKGLPIEHVKRVPASCNRRVPSADATTRSCCCWHVLGCEQAKWRPSRWRTSIGKPGGSPCGAKVTATLSFPYQPMSGRRSRLT